MVHILTTTNILLMTALALGIAVLFAWTDHILVEEHEARHAR